MLPALGHHRILLTVALSFMALGAGPAAGSERGREARNKIAACGEQGVFLSYVDNGYASVASRSFSVHYWRGPCMLYWSGEEAAAPVVRDRKSVV